MRRLALALALVPQVLPAEPGPPVFTDRSTGMEDQVYGGGWTHFVGGGVAILDCDGDAMPELLTAGGANPTRLWHNDTSPGGDIAFSALPFDDPGEVTGAYPLDMDGDGRLDLAVLRVGPNRYYRGGPDCAFTDATAAWGLPERNAWSTAFSATWEPGNDRPTLAIGNYVDRSDPAGPFEACDTNLLLRPEGEGYAATELSPGYCALSMLFSDWQRSGRADLRVSNDRHYYVKGGHEQIWRLDPLTERVADEGLQRLMLWGMGIASQDITGDGLPEVLLTSMGDQWLMYNRGDHYEAAPYETGATATRPFLGDDGRPSTGWHAQFADVDNDGVEDLFIAKGNVDQMPGLATEDPNNLLMGRADGTFVEAAGEAGIATMARSRGAGLADLNADGRLDLVVVNRRAPLEVWQNATPGTGHWLEVTLQQPGGNSRAVGAVIELRRPDGTVVAREVTVGGGHASGRAVPEHFGLGEVTRAELRVRWPGGTVSDWQPVDADTRLRLSPDGTGLRTLP